MLIFAAIAWPLGWLRRRHFRAAAPAPAGPRWAVVGSRVGAVAVLVATIAWVSVLMTILSNVSVPDMVLRPIQVVQVLGVLGVVPAAVHALALVRASARWTRVIGGLLTLLALVGAAWFALAFHLVGLSTSY